MNISIRDLPPIGGVLVILFFFLPWISVSCSLSPGISIDASGYEIASGNYGELSGLSEVGSLFGQPDIGRADSIPLMWVFVLLGLGSLGAFSKGRTGLLAALGSGIAGMIALLIFAITAGSYTNEIALGGFNMSLKPGYWLTWMGFLLQSGTAFYASRQTAVNGIRIPGIHISVSDELDGRKQAEAGIPPHPPPMAAPLATLNFVSGPMMGREIPVTKSDFLIGRGSMCDLQLKDVKVSRQHARLRYAGGNWFIQDQGSAGGVFINGAKVDAARIYPTDHVKIGESEFLVLV